MPSLAGLFGRKKASKLQRSNAAAETDSGLSSPTTDWVTTDKSLPSSPNGASSLGHSDNPHKKAGYGSVYPSLALTPTKSNSSRTGSKLKLPFSRRKQASGATSTTSVVSVGQDSSFSQFNTPPRPSYLTTGASTPRSSTSDIDFDSRRLRPPPSKSAIFAAYEQQHNLTLSTRSLPNESPLPNSPPPVPPKKPGFFNWSKTVPKSAPPSEETSFNLKSFRHVGLPSQTPSPNVNSTTNVNSLYSSPATSPTLQNLSPTTTLSPPIPRPRGMSGESSSQRISVAAFREAQARRSTAGSPSPSLRSPSPALPQSSSSKPLTQQKRQSLLAYADSDSDEEEEEEESDDGEGEETITASSRGGGVGRRQRTLTKRGTKSEIGHGTGYGSALSSRASPREHPGIGNRAQSSHILVSEYPGPEKEPPRSQSSLGFNTVQRQRASVSTSAATPSRDAKRASILASVNAASTGGGKRHSRAISDHSIHLPRPSSPPTSITSSSANQHQHTRHPASSSSHSNSHLISSKAAPTLNLKLNSDSDSSEDDTPLATLVPPRRPGSALSSRSSSSLTTAAGKPKPLIDINELTRGRPVLPNSKNMDEGFTNGRTLLSSTATSGVGEGRLKTSVSPPRKFISPPSSPKRESGKLHGLTTTTPLPSPSLPGLSGMDSPRDGLGDRLNRVLAASNVGSVATTPIPPVASRSMTMPVLPTTAPGASSASSVSVAPTKVRSNTSLGATSVTSTTTFATGTTSPPEPKATPRHVVVTKSVGVPIKLSPPIDDLADVLGAGVHLIRRTSDEIDEDEMEEDSEDDDDDEDDEEEDDSDAEVEVTKRPDEILKPIAPIPIKQRAPAPAFSVTSRPPLSRGVVPTSSSSIAKEREEKEKEVDVGRGTRQRSSTLIPSSSTSASFGLANDPITDSATKQPTRGFGPSNGRERENSRPPTTRQRSSTLIPGSVSAPTLSPIPSTSTSHSVDGGASPSNTNSKSLNPNTSRGSNTIAMPNRPFATSRRESPAGSSTGDSSSGRAPITPRDGSDVGSRSSALLDVSDRSDRAERDVGRVKERGWERQKEKEREEKEWSGGASGLGLGLGGRHIKRRSVSFEEDSTMVGGGRSGRSETKGVSAGVERMSVVKEREVQKDGEERRKERRRSEAKAAIELGKVINGRGPILDDDEDDDDLPINQTLANAQGRMATLNPMMGGFTPGMPWNVNLNMGAMPAMPAMGMNPGMMPPGDPTYMVAHQQAMMYAKQAYQMAVAQQAMAAAGDEWERGSTMGGAGSVYGGNTPSVVGSTYGMPSMMGMGMGMNMNMPPMMNMGMGMGMPGNGWSTGSVIFPNGATRSSVYGGGISGSRSEYGGGKSGQWSSSKSAYGDYSSSNRNSKAMAAGRGRDSTNYPPMPPIPQSASASSSVPRARTTSQPAAASKGARRAPPPSSWKAGV